MMTPKHWPLLALLVGALAAPACERSAPRDPQESAAKPEHHEESGEATHVAVSTEQRAALGIEVAAAGPGRIDAPVELLGEVVPNGDHLAHIVPRFPGIVREVRKVAGDTVRAGDILAVIESSESLVRYDLRTLINGVVIAKHLTVGEAVGPEKHAFLIADLSTLWVDLSVYQKDLAEVAVGQSVRIHAVQAGPDAEGKIAYVSCRICSCIRFMCSLICWRYCSGVTPSGNVQPAPEPPSIGQPIMPGPIIHGEPAPQRPCIQPM